MEANTSVSHAPTREEIRVHCLEMATRAGVLMGRGDGILGVAEQFYEWVVRPDDPPGDRVPVLGSKPAAEPTSEAASAEHAEGTTIKADPPVVRDFGGNTGSPALLGDLPKPVLPSSVSDRRTKPAA